MRLGNPPGCSTKAIYEGVTPMMAAYLLLSSGLFLIVAMALAVAVRPEGTDSSSETTVR